MKVEIKVTENFRKRAKPLLKKYPSLLNELENLEKELTTNPLSGQSLGNNAYKIRLSIQSKGKGKSGGARVITTVEGEVVGTIVKEADGKTIVYLLTIYDKSETESISANELKKLISKRNI